MTMSLPVNRDEPVSAAPRLPRLIDIGGEPMLLRPMNAADADRVLAFFLALPSADLLFLRRDVTTGPALGDWLAEVERGETLTLLALSEGEVMGEATLHRTGVPWSAHVGIVRVFTAAMHRGRGLGRLLLDAVCAQAAALGVEKLVAEMTVEQLAARALMAQVGFREEARLTRYVKDRLGQPHDLLIMTRELAPSAPPRTGGVTVSAWRCTACGLVLSAIEPPNGCSDCGASAGFLIPAIED